MDKEVKELIALGKDSIVELALKSLNSRSYQTNEKASKENFKKIEVCTNGKIIYVSFFNPIKYIPQKTVFYCDVLVGLLGGVSSKDAVSNPADYGSTIPNYKIPFYKETKEMKRNMQFVFEAIDKSNEIGSVGGISNFVDDMTIREYENYYDILVLSESQESSYKIEKITGKIYDDQHAHLEPDPFEIENEYKDINWN
ncbi:hypothetical protein Q4Q39_18090 [Flavivirga amylovorans]|uniref:DUF4304 domain-containing protein n=1 Tax=Flavivirga amylovorans TaxID=870486 RepID=A0ABT8X701_9FLAO|nr:hypothetical protein [Flavivirga amylovorans]MDO5989319.1 hypothetical protein [Flavivirga amylovorans]